VIALADGLIWSEIGAAMPGFRRELVTCAKLSGASGGAVCGHSLPSAISVKRARLRLHRLYSFAQYVNYLWPHLTRRQPAQSWSRWRMTTALLYRRHRCGREDSGELMAGTLLMSQSWCFPDHFISIRKSRSIFRRKHFNSPWLLLGLGAAGGMIYDYLGYYDVCFAALR